MSEPNQPDQPEPEIPPHRKKWPEPRKVMTDEEWAEGHPAPAEEEPAAPAAPAPAPAEIPAAPTEEGN